MKTMMRWIGVLALLVVLLMPAPAYASGLSDRLQDEFVTGSYTLEEGETLDGNLWIMGGSATIEKGSRVSGDVMLVGGSLSVDGEINGNIVATGGLLELNADASVDGDIQAFGAHLDRSSGAYVGGEVITGPRGPVNFSTPMQPFLSGLNWGLGILTFFLQIFLLAALAVLVMMFWPRHIERTAEAATSFPVIAGGLGLLTLAAAPAVLVVLTITIILIPVSLLLALVLGVVALFGWVALGIEVGRRLADMLHQEWAPPVSAGLGTLLLTLVTFGIAELVPCVGWLVPVTLGMIGVGAVLLTRFGTQPYQGYRSGSVPVVPPVAPVPPPGTAAPTVMVVAPDEPVEADETVMTQGDDEAALDATILSERDDLPPASLYDEDATFVGGAKIYPAPDAAPPAGESEEEPPPA